MGLAEELTKNSLDAVTTQIDGYFEGQIKAKRQTAEAILSTIESRERSNTRDRATVAALQAEIDSLEKARKVVSEAVASTSKPRGKLYYFGSRSGETDGHYIEHYKDGTARCSCPAGVFGRECWAVKNVKTNASSTFGLGLGRYESFLKPEHFDRVFNQAAEKSKSR